MDVLENFDYLRHDNNLLYDFLDDLGDFNDSLLSNEDRV